MTMISFDIGPCPCVSTAGFMAGWDLVRGIEAGPIRRRKLRHDTHPWVISRYLNDFAAGMDEARARYVELNGDMSLP